MSDMRLYVFFFFFKQKTAYEMRISDWSSDVCSSDLARKDGNPTGPLTPTIVRGSRMLISFSTNSVCCHCSKTFHKTDKRQKACRPCAELSRLQKLPHQIEAKRAYHRDYGRQLRRKRSEEHTSELQSLMRISYAVFCLKKQNKSKHNSNTHNKTTNQTTRQNITILQ